MRGFPATFWLRAFLLRALRGKPSRSRSSTTAPMAAAFRSAWGPSDLSDRARRPAPSIARARQMLLARKNACGFWHIGRPGDAGSGAGLKAEEANRSLD